MGLIHGPVNIAAHRNNQNRIRRWIQNSCASFLKNTWFFLYYNSYILELKNTHVLDVSKTHVCTVDRLFIGIAICCPCVSFVGSTRFFAAFIGLEGTATVCILEVAPGIRWVAWLPLSLCPRAPKRRKKELSISPLAPSLPLVSGSVRAGLLAPLGFPRAHRRPAAGDLGLDPAPALTRVRGARTWSRRCGSCGASRCSATSSGWTGTGTAAGATPPPPPPRRRTSSSRLPRCVDLASPFRFVGERASRVGGSVCCGCGDLAGELRFRFWFSAAAIAGWWIPRDWFWWPVRSSVVGVWECGASSPWGLHKKF